MSGFFSDFSDINWYLTNTVMIVYILILAFVGQKSKRTIMGGVVTPMTMASEKKWKQVHRFNAIIVYAVFVPLLVVNTIFFIMDKQGSYEQIITTIVDIGVIAYFVILMTYTDILERKWLAEQRRKGHPVSDFMFRFPGIPKRRLIIGLVIFVAIIIVFPILEHIFHF